MKKDDSRKDKIPWGTLFTEPSDNGLINFIAWKDNALVLFISTVDDGSQVTKKLRKRPLETSSSAKTSRVPFRGQARALLNIPAFNDDYNHGIGYVDEGNHLKKANTYMRKYYKGGHQSLVT
jgi:hypothetical protein